MNFYLDFEATQFSNQIISIGCVSENGKTFSTLVNPGEKIKISKFITELTGITKDMLSAAPDMDEAFDQLQSFICACDSFHEPHYFCYGDCDATFIKASIQRMHNIQSIIFAQSILYALFDYSKSVKKFFNAEQAIALRKIFSFIQEDEVVQKHDALEDALMLKEVAIDMAQFCHPDDLEKIRNIPGQKKPLVNSKKRKAPDSFTNLIGSTWECDTGTAADAQFKCISPSGKVKYFSNIETAVMWLIKYICGGSPKDDGIIRHRKKEILKAVHKESKYCGFYWKEKK